MYMHMSKIAALIPARRGSKRVTNKNLKMFAGKPLLKWTFDEVLKVKQLTNIFFTTDYLPKELGFKFPDGITWISRPPELCQESSKASEYIHHFFERYPQFEVVVLLQPTSPLRTADDIEQALNKYLKSNHKMLVSCYKLFKSKLYRSSGGSVFSGGEFKPYEEPIYYRNSAIYIFTKERFMINNSIFSAVKTIFYEMPFGRSFDVDMHQDFQYAERMIKYNNGVGLYGLDNCIDISPISGDTDNSDNII